MREMSSPTTEEVQLGQCESLAVLCHAVLCHAVYVPCCVCVMLCMRHAVYVPCCVCAML